MDTKLIIRVESMGAKQATTDLAALEAQGAKTERATDSLARTIKAGGETAEQASARIKDMVAASLAQQSAAKGATAAQLAATTATETATAGVVEYSAATRARIAAQNEAMGSLKAFVTAEAESATAATAATAAIEAETESLVGLKLASGGAVREYTALLDEILSGRTGRTPGTLAVLGSRLGLTQKLFTGVGLSVTTFVTALATLAVIETKAEQADAGLNDTLERTGGYLGVTAGQFKAMASDIATGNITIGQAKKVLLEVANTGQFTGQQIEKIGQAALDMSKVTGMSVESAIKEFVKLGEDPVRESAKLNQQYHYLKASVFDQIDALERLGKTQQAGELAQEAAAKMAHQRNADMEQNLGAIQQGWQNVEKAASSAWNAIVDSFRAKTAESELATLKEDLQELQHPGLLMRLTTSDSVRKQSIAYLQDELAAKQKVTSANEADAKEVARIAQHNADAIAATQKYGTSDPQTQALLQRFHDEAAQMANETLPELKTPEIHIDSVLDPPKPPQIKKINDQYSRLGKTLGDTLRTSIGDYFSGINEDWGQLLRRMAIEAAESQIFSLLASFTGPVGATARFLGFGDSSVAHFATGGSFMVGGSGGTDSQLVSFRASPNERVTVQTPGQMANQGVTIVNHVDARGATDPAAVEAAVARGVATAVQISDARVSTRLRALARPSIA